MSCLASGPVLPLAVKSQQVTGLDVFPPQTLGTLRYHLRAEGPRPSFSPFMRILSLLSYLEICVIENVSSFLQTAINNKLSGCESVFFTRLKMFIVTFSPGAVTTENIFMSLSSPQGRKLNLEKKKLSAQGRSVTKPTN